MTRGSHLHRARSLPVPESHVGAYSRLALMWTVGTGLCGLLATLFWYVEVRPLWSPNSVTVLALLATVCAAGLLLVARGSGVIGFVGVYGAYLAVSHLGLVVPLMLWPEAGRGYYVWEFDWLALPERPVAVALSGLAVGSFVLGSVLTRRVRPNLDRGDIRESVGWYARRVADWSGIYWVGLGLLAFAALYMATAVATGALPLAGGYREYRIALREVGWYHVMLFALATGMAFTMASGSAVQRRIAVAVFAVPAVLIGITGSRGAVLWPLAAGLAVATTRGYRPGMKVVALAALLFFVYIPVAGQVRGQRLAEASIRDVSMHWTSPFVTNGWTLRPLVFTVQWIDHGEAHSMGGTYLLPARRIIGAITPFVTRPEYDAVPYSWSNLHTRIPRQGYSVVAEAYYNFGVLGVLVVMGGIGAVLNLLGRHASGASSLALGGATLVVLLNNVRNYSVFVPGQLLGVLVLWTAGLVLTVGLSRGQGADAAKLRTVPSQSGAR